MLDKYIVITYTIYNDKQLTKQKKEVVIMNNNIEKIALSKKGQFTSLEYTKACKVKKNSPEIIKTTKVLNARIGCSYDALKSTQEAKGVDNKAEAEKLNTGLRGMEWINYPTVLKSIKTDKHYIRLETAKNTRFNTTYRVNGVEVDKADIEQYLQSSEKRTGEMPVVMNIGVDDINYIH